MPYSTGRTRLNHLIILSENQLFSLVKKCIPRNQGHMKDSPASDFIVYPCVVMRPQGQTHTLWCFRKQRRGYPRLGCVFRENTRAWLSLYTAIQRRFSGGNLAKCIVCDVLTHTWCYATPVGYQRVCDVRTRVDRLAKPSNLDSCLFVLLCSTSLTECVCRTWSSVLTQCVCHTCSTVFCIDVICSNVCVMCDMAWSDGFQAVVSNFLRVFFNFSIFNILSNQVFFIIFSLYSCLYHVCSHDLHLFSTVDWTK
jgi:hypothetical protein